MIGWTTKTNKYFNKLDTNIYSKNKKYTTQILCECNTKY
jgi:hypothetical protein